VNIKAIALDMDGTLLGPDNSIDNDLIHLLSELQQRNIRIFIATGRTSRDINSVLPKHIQVDGIVSANGMGCYTNTKQLAEHTLDPVLVEAIVSQARKEKMYYELHPMEEARSALEEDKQMLENEVNKARPDTLLENEYNSRKRAVMGKINWVKELSTENIAKIHFFSMSPDMLNDWKNTLEQMKTIKDFSTSSSTLHNVEVMVGDVSKATGIKMLLEEYGISPKELMAIGDGENDLPMFELAAYSVAMQNAEDIVKSKADEVTKQSYEENGLYTYLMEKFKDHLLDVQFV
jgi:5-amino-6-(5-phospho-D-ribitylamino)uracil phosphatase